jgi:hypothetical protein
MDHAQEEERKDKRIEENSEDSGKHMQDSYAP